MTSERSTAELLRTAFGLELARARAIVALEGPMGEADRLAAELEPTLSALSARGSQLPTHMLAKRYVLSQLDYLVMLLAIDNDVSGDSAAVHRVSDIARVALDGLDATAIGQVFERLAVCVERLVELTDEDDPALKVTQSVRELVGL